MIPTAHPIVALLAIVLCACTGTPPSGEERGFLSYAQPRLPLQLEPEPALAAWTAEAQLFWSETISPTLFAEAGVVVTLNFDDTIRNRGQASYRLDGGRDIAACFIVIAPDRGNARTVAHEVGHCLGLEDDEGTGYLMDTGGDGIELSPYDTELLLWLIE